MGGQLSPGRARSWRVAAGLPLIAVGRKARIERTRLGQWETGYCDLHSDELKRLRRVLLEAMDVRVRTLAKEFDLQITL